jgi:hypothetical protein
MNLIKLIMGKNIPLGAKRNWYLKKTLQSFPVKSSEGWEHQLLAWAYFETCLFEAGFWADFSIGGLSKNWASKLIGFATEIFEDGGFGRFSLG